MAQIRIKQVAQLEQSLNSITGVTTVVESYTTNQTTGNTGIKNTFEAKEVVGVKVHVNGLQIEDFSWQNVTTDYLPAQSILIFDSVAAGFELQSTDIIKLTYEYLANGSSTYTGSGSGSTGPAGPQGAQGSNGEEANVDFYKQTSSQSTVCDPNIVQPVLGNAGPGNLNLNFIHSVVSRIGTGSKDGNYVGAFDTLNLTKSYACSFEHFNSTDTIGSTNWFGYSNGLYTNANLTQTYDMLTVGDIVYRDSSGNNYFPENAGFMMQTTPTNGIRETLHWVSIGANGIVLSITKMEDITPSNGGTVNVLSGSLSSVTEEGSNLKFTMSNGDSFVDSLSGTSGAQGAAGPQGATGAQGAAGSGGSGNTSGTVDGHLMPDANDTYDLGGPEYKFRDLYLGNNTLYMGDKSLSRTNLDDSMEIKNISIPSSPTSEGNRGDVVFDDTYMYICINTNSWKRINLDTTW